MKKTWTPEKIAKLREMRAAGTPIKILAKDFATTPCAILKTCERNGITREVKKSASSPKTTLTEDLTKADEVFWQKRCREVETKYQKLLSEKTVVDRLVSDIEQLAPRSYEAAPGPTGNRREFGIKSTPQEAVLHISDSHGGQVVSADQTMFFGNYDLEVFMDRLAYLEDAVRSICVEHVTTRIPALHIAWGGDLLHGDLLHSNEAAHVVTLFDQFYQVGHAFARFVRNISPVFEQVHCWGVVGNHTRWANQKRMPAVNRFSNLDMFCMALMEALTREIPNVSWHLSRQPFVEFSVLGWAHHLSHGDHLKGGDRALGVPAHALGRELSVTSQLFAKHGKQPVNYYLHGHFHRPMELPHAAGEILVNGGWPGVDEYALTNHFNPADPQQRLYFVHPEYGRTANYYLSLKHAKPGEGIRYALLKS